MPMVLSILSKCLFSNAVRRNFSIQTSLKLERLPNRSILKLTGEEICPFLQGLITNDVNHLNKRETGSLFAFFLNSKGRVLYDTLIFKNCENEIFLECDSSILDNLIKHLKTYRIRKKINVEPLNNEIWVIFNENKIAHDRENFANIEQFTFCSYILQDCDHQFEKFKESLRDENIVTFRDPRLRSLGYRIIASPSINVEKVLSCRGIRANGTENYTILRYQLGVAEGVKELPPGNCFPLEANCDYLHGVSFHKGCYLGQELTARTHHTGVVRKRLMPLILSSSVPEFDQDLTITTEEDKKVGKLRGVSGNYGIALLRIVETLESDSKLKVAGIPASTFIPFWWPQELKEGKTFKI